MIDYLVNNAGFGDNGPFLETNWDKQQRMIELNITALTHLTRLFLPEIVRRGEGGLLNVASTAGFLPGPYMSVYYASKAYVLSFTEAIAQEVAGTKVKVSALCPGPVRTEFMDVAGIKNAAMFNALTELSAEKVARIGYRGLMRGKVVNISGLTMKVLIHSLRTSPRSLIRRISAFMARNKA
ncbi:MAG: SDR family NAD(P)-dependent oxidoreductase [Calditrichaeota bacterium]|nr:MAG: SDR family NAD(P)-dependent oxidoreductase [Calditrichota bacterium]